MANWIGVITNGGNDLLNEWVSERELRFDSAAAGSGTVAVASMMAQTALAAQKQEASIIGADKVDGGVRLKLRISAHETGYTLNQYGVWASLTGGDSILVALFQHEQGIQVPSKNESPDFVYTFYALIGCSNTGTWTVNIDTSAVVSGAEMDRAIAEATNGLQPKITTSGLLKGDGKGNITAAAGGTDYAWPTLSGSGAPTETTKGETMQRYHDTDTDKEYVCTGKSADGKYVWKLSGGGDEVPAHASNHATGGSDPITPASIGAIPSSDKGKAGGVATLDNSGKVPSGQIPSLEYAAKTHASTHATGGSDPITPESIGAAPVLKEGKTIYVSTTGSDETGTGAELSPYATIQKAIDSLPKNLGGNTVTIKVSSGTYNAVSGSPIISATNFYNGWLDIRGPSSSDKAVLNGNIYSNKCNATVRFLYLKAVGTDLWNDMQFQNGCIYISDCQNVLINTCDIDGVDKSESGIFVGGQSNVGISRGDISNCDKAITTRSSNSTRGLATVSIYEMTGSNNNVFIHSEAAVVSDHYGNSVSATTQYSKLGGIIIKQDGTVEGNAEKPKLLSVSLKASGWDSSAKTQTVTVSGVLADETKQLITPTPALASQAAYYDAVILCTGQAAGQLTFTAKKVPTDDLTVYVTIQEVGA